MTVASVECNEDGRELKNMEEAAAPLEASQTPTSNFASPLSVELKEVLDRRARYRTVVLFVSLISVVLVLTTIATPIKPEENSDGDNRTKRVVLFVAPSLHPELLKLSIESNKAPFISLVISAGGRYLYAQPEGRDSVDVDTPQGSSVMGEWSEGGMSLSSTEFLKVLEQAGKRSVVLAPSFGAHQDSHEGDGRTEVFLRKKESLKLFENDVLDAFQHLIASDGDLLYINTDTGSEVEEPGERKDLAALSSVGIIDSTLERITAAVTKHSQVSAEKWLILLIAAGRNGIDGVSVLGSSYSAGKLVDIESMREAVPSVNVQAVLLRWFGLASATDS